MFNVTLGSKHENQYYLTFSVQVDKRNDEKYTFYKKRNGTKDSKTRKYYRLNRECRTTV